MKNWIELRIFYLSICLFQANHIGISLLYNNTNKDIILQIPFLGIMLELCEDSKTGLSVWITKNNTLQEVFNFTKIN